MSYNQDVFIDNCVMRLVQIAAAIRQNNDRMACQEFDAEEIDCQSCERSEQSFDAFPAVNCTDNASSLR